MERGSRIFTGPGMVALVAIVVAVSTVAALATGGESEAEPPIAFDREVRFDADYDPRFNDAQVVSAAMPQGEWNEQGWLFVANEVGRGVSVYDVATQQPVAWLYSPDAAVPHHPYVSPDQRWVMVGARFGSQTMVIDAENGFETTFLTWPEAADGGVAGPLHGIYTWEGDRFLTALQRSGRVGVVDLTGDEPEIAEVIDVGERPRDIYVTPDDAKAFVTMQRESTVAVIDLETYEVRYIQRSDTDYSDGSGGGGGMSTDGALFAVSNTIDDEVVIIDTATEEVVQRISGVPAPVNAEFLGKTHIVGTGNRSDGTVTFIDADSGELLKTVETGGGANIPYLGPRGYIWVSHNGARHISVLSPDTYEVMAEIPTGVNPHWIHFTPNGSRAFVSNWGEKTVSIIDTLRWEELGRLDTGLNPNGMAMKTDITEDEAEAALARAAEEGVAEKIAMASEMVLPEPRDDQEQVFLNTCTQCHDLGRIVRNNAKGDQWAAIVERMKGNGAQMDDEQMSEIIDYLSSGRQQDLEFGTKYDEYHERSEAEGAGG